MHVGLAYDLKNSVNIKPGAPEDIAEEYDSIETIQLITSSLEALGNKVIPLGGGMEFLYKVCEGVDVDIVFNISEGRGNYKSREAQVPSVLEMCDIPYTGSSPQCLSICLDKPLTKYILKSYGIITPNWLIANDRRILDTFCWEKLAFPLVVKPANEGSSIGIHNCSIVHNSQEARAACLDSLGAYSQSVMVEEYISGKEVTVGIIGSGKPEVFGVMEIKPKQQQDHFLYSVEVKRDYVNLIDYECPATLPDIVLEEVKKTSLKVYNLLGCRDMSRLDFRISEDGKPYFIEINPLPGLGNHSDLVIMANLMGISHKKVIRMILSSALERYPQCV